MTPGSRESRMSYFRGASLRYSSTDAFGTVVGVADRFRRQAQPSGVPKSSATKRGTVGRRATFGSSVGECRVFGNTNSVTTPRECSIECAPRLGACAATPSWDAERIRSLDFARRVGMGEMPTVLGKVPGRAITIGADYGWML